MRGGGSSAGGGWECGRERGGRVRGEVRLWVFDVSGSDGGWWKSVGVVLNRHEMRMYIHTEG